MVYHNIITQQLLKHDANRHPDSRPGFDWVIDWVRCQVVYCCCITEWGIGYRTATSTDALELLAWATYGCTD